MRIAITLSLALLASCSRTDSKEAESAARDFARNVPGTTGVNCATSDSDGDGYVSCTIFRGTGEPMQVQCGSETLCVWNCARGCKYVPSMKVSGPRVGL